MFHELIHSWRDLRRDLLLASSPPLTVEGGSEEEEDGGEGDEGDKGAYDVYAAYRYLGNYATFSPTWAGDGSAVYGAKGWEIGTNVTFMKNMVARLSYFDGKYISKNYNDGKDVNQVFGEVDIFF